jgi:hypothetical protein
MAVMHGSEREMIDVRAKSPICLTALGYPSEALGSSARQCAEEILQSRGKPIDCFVGPGGTDASTGTARPCGCKGPRGGAMVRPRYHQGLCGSRYLSGWPLMPSVATKRWMLRIPNVSHWRTMAEREGFSLCLSTTPLRTHGSTRWLDAKNAVNRLIF